MSVFACMRKRKYNTKVIAQSAIYRLRARNQDTGALEPYQCQLCGSWHLGRPSFQVAA